MAACSSGIHTEVVLHLPLAVAYDRCSICSVCAADSTSNSRQRTSRAAIATAAPAAAAAAVAVSTAQHNTSQDCSDQHIMKLQHCSCTRAHHGTIYSTL
eukprot:3455-Heterococcus_DN1.PRE.1